MSHTFSSELATFLIKDSFFLFRGFLAGLSASLLAFKADLLLYFLNNPSIPPYSLTFLTSQGPTQVVSLPVKLHGIFDPGIEPLSL